MIKFLTFSLIFHISLIAFLKIKDFNKNYNTPKVINISYVEKKVEKKVERKAQKKVERKAQKKSRGKTKIKQKKMKDPEKKLKKENKEKNKKQANSTKNFDDMLKDLAKKDLDENKNIEIEKKIKDLSDKKISNKNQKSNKKEIQQIASLMMSQINNNWTRPPALKGTDNLVIKLEIHLDQAGNVYEIVIPDVTKKQLEKNKFLKPLLDSAIRAIKRSSPFEGLQKHSYNKWKKNTINFRPFENMQ